MIEEAALQAVLPMVESMLADLKRTAGLEGRLNGEIWDQGDAVGAWLGTVMNVIVFPTAETLKRVCGRACRAHLRLRCRHCRQSASTEGLGFNSDAFFAMCRCSRWRSSSPKIYY